MRLSASSDFTATRHLTQRGNGHGHGPVVRLMSPSELGQIIKPFVFLGLIDGPSSFFERMPMHQHSGIATVTVVTEGNLHFDDPEASRGAINYSGVE